MTSIVFNLLRITSINLERNMKSHHEHFFSPTKMFDFTEKLEYYMRDYKAWVPLVNEYCATWLHTLVFSTLLYILAANIEYWVLYIWKKDKFMPKYNNTNFMLYHEISWSVIDIIGTHFLNF